MHEGRILAIIGAVLIWVAFIMPWIRLPLLGSMSMWNMATTGIVESPGEEPKEPLITTLIMNDSLLLLGAALYFLSLIGAVFSLSDRIGQSKVLPLVIRFLTGFATIIGGISWVVAVESKRVTFLSIQLLGVEYAPYVVIIGGCLMVAACFVESLLRKEEKQPGDSGMKSQPARTLTCYRCGRSVPEGVRLCPYCKTSLD